jgi:hypothetical protein
MVRSHSDGASLRSLRRRARAVPRKPETRVLMPPVLVPTPLGKGTGGNALRDCTPMKSKNPAFVRE